MAIPNYQHLVAEAAAKYPAQWRNAHTNNAQTEDFIRLLAADLHAIDSRCGLNGKRGNPTDISDDVIAIKGEGSAVDIVNGGAMEIIDVIGGAGGPNPQPQWAIAPGGAGDKGAWVKPAGSVPTPGPTPTPVKPCPDPSAHVPKPKPQYQGDAYYREKLGKVLAADYARRPQAMDDGSVVWAARVIWDHINHGLTMEDAIKKHREGPDGWLTALGLTS